MKQDAVTPRRAWLASLLTLLALTTTPAFALSPEFGVSATPATGGGPAIAAHVGLPVLELGDTDPIDLVARLDIATLLTFDTWPSIGLTALARGTNDGFDTYLGTGIALAWIDQGGPDQSFIAWTLLAGARYPVTDTLYARAELAVAPLAQGMGVSIGVDWTPWR